MDDDATPAVLRLNDQLGQTSVAPGPTGYSIEAVQVCVEAAYKAGRAAERERWEAKARDMAANYRRNGLAAEADGLESLVIAMRGSWA